MFALAATLSLIVPSSSTMLPWDTQETQAKWMVEAYRANREAFQRFQCRFVIKKGKVASLKDALEGTLLDCVSAECTWIVDGAKERHSVKVDPSVFEKAFVKGKTEAEHQKAAKGFTFSTPLAASEFLSDGELSLAYSPPLQSANLMTPGDVRRTEYTTPFNYGIMGKDESFHPGRLLKDAREGRCKYSLQKVTNHQRVVLQGLGFEYSEGASDKFGFDPNAVFLPTVCLRTYGPKPKNRREIYVTAVQQCKSGWYPSRVVSVAITEKESGEPTDYATLLEVLEMDCESKIPESAFTLRMPEGSYVVGSTDLRASVKLASQTDVSLGHLSELKQRCEKTLVERQKDPAFSQWVFLQAISESHALYWWLGAFVCVCFSVILYLRRQRLKAEVASPTARG